MTSSKEQMTKFKSSIIDNALNFLKDSLEYRWDDVLDYICEHWDLDNEWETYFADVCKRCNVDSLDVFYQRQLDIEENKREHRLTQEQALGNIIGMDLKERFEKDLEKEL